MEAYDVRSTLFVQFYVERIDIFAQREIHHFEPLLPIKSPLL